MTNASYNCVEECKSVSQALSEQYLANVTLRSETEYAAVFLAREEAAASDRLTGIHPPTVIKIKIANDPQVAAAVDAHRAAQGRLLAGEAAVDGLTARFQAAKALLQHEIAMLTAARDTAAPAEAPPGPAPAAAAAPTGKLQALKSLVGWSA